jgi:hypothetical protein
MPTAPRSSTKAHSAAIRLTTSSAVKIGGILLPSHLSDVPTFTGRLFRAPALKLYRSWVRSLRGVIPEIDIWRAAALVLKRYGEQALEESAARADELMSAGDDDGGVTWRRIMDAVTQLENNTPPGAVH